MTGYLAIERTSPTTFRIIGQDRRGLRFAVAPGHPTAHDAGVRARELERILGLPLRTAEIVPLHAPCDRSAAP